MKLSERENVPNKYQIAKTFRDGCCACLKGQAIDPLESEAFIDGYEWGYRFVKPTLNDEMNRYVQKRGFRPFAQIEAMRK